MSADDYRTITWSQQPFRMDLQQIREYIEHHYHEPLTIPQLAQMAGLNPGVVNQPGETVFTGIGLQDTGDCS